MQNGGERGLPFLSAIHYPSRMDHSAFLERMQAHFQQALEYRHTPGADPLRLERRISLRRWQAARLMQTYADLIKQPRFQKATVFFFSDLYGAGDSSIRDAQLSRALPTMIKLMPAKTLEPLALALEVDALSERLDAALADELFPKSSTSAAIDPPSYATAYRTSANRAERVHQIDLLVDVGLALDRIASSPLVVAAVTMMRAPAKKAGFDALQSFLDRGLTAFRAMHGAADFLDTIRSREMRIATRLFERHDAPFDLDDPIAER